MLPLLGPAQDLKTTSSLEYPKAPFGPALSELLSLLPPGFHDLTVSEKVSFPLIRILDRVQTLLRDQRRSTLHWHDLFMHIFDRFPAPEMTQIEQFLYRGLIAFSYQQCDETIREDDYSLLTNVYLHFPSKEVYDLPSIAATGESFRRCLVWVHLCMMSAMEPRTPVAHGKIFRDYGRILDPIFGLFSTADELEWNNVGVILKEQFFLPDALQVHWKTCWDDALARRQE